MVRAKGQVIQLGGDGACCPPQVSRLDGSVRAPQDFVLGEALRLLDEMMTGLKLDLGLAGLQQRVAEA